MDKIFFFHEAIPFTYSKNINGIDKVSLTYLSQCTCMFIRISHIIDLFSSSDRGKIILYHPFIITYFIFIDSCVCMYIGEPWLLFFSSFLVLSFILFHFIS